MNTYKLGDTGEGLLPIGLYDPSTGKYTRYAEVDEWTGIDQEQLTTKAARKSPGKAMQNVLRRLLQRLGEEGDVLKKQGRFNLCDARHVENMHQADIEFLLFKSFVESGDYEQDVPAVCSHCEAEIEETVDLRELDVYEHDHTTPPKVEFELSRGIKDDDGIRYKKATFHYPTGKVMDYVSRQHEKGDHYMMSALMSKCLEVEGYGKVSLEVARRMAAKDRNKVIKTLSEIVPGVDVTKEIECPVCGEKTEVKVDLSLLFQAE